MLANDMRVAGTEDNNCALHWLQFSINPGDTLRADTMLQMICEELFYKDFQNFEASRNTLEGFRSYKTRYDNDGITILTDHYVNGGIMVLLTGQACDTTAPDLQLIAMYLNYHGGKTSRIDIAIDDHRGILDIATINQARLDNTCITRIEKARGIDESNLKTGITTSPTVTFGSEKSDFQIRFYDRAAKEGTEGHWIRCELQCRNDYASAIMKQIEDGKSLASVAMGILQAKLSFRVPKGDNRKRWQICEWWSEFLQETEKLSLGICKDRQESSPEKSLKWLEKSVAPALATIRRHYGIGKIEAICDMGDLRHKTRRNQKQVAFKEVKVMPPAG